MITVLDSDDLNQYGNINITTLKKAELSFRVSGSFSDGIQNIEPALPVTSVPPAEITVTKQRGQIFDLINFITTSYPTSAITPAENNLGGVLPGATTVVDTSKRLMCDVLIFGSAVETDLISYTEEPLSITTPSWGALGFCTDNVRSSLWDKTKSQSLVGELDIESSTWYSDFQSNNTNPLSSSSVPIASQNPVALPFESCNYITFLTPSYNDSQVNSEAVLSGAMPLATVPRYKYFDGLLNFTAPPLTNVAGLLPPPAFPDTFVQTLGSSQNLRRVPLSGVNIPDRDFTIVILDEAGNRVLHKGSASASSNHLNSFETEENKVIVVAISNDTTKKSYVYPNINIEGVNL